MKSKKQLENMELRDSSTRLHQHLEVLAATRPDGMAGAIEFCRVELSAEYHRMLAAVAASHWANAARAAHNLGSIGALVDIPELHSTARVAEAAFRGGDVSLLPALLVDAERAFNHALQLLSAPTG